MQCNDRLYMCELNNKPMITTTKQSKIRNFKETNKQREKEVLVYKWLLLIPA